MRSRDTKAVLQAVFSSWLPLSTALLVSVVEYLPSPPVAQATRLPELIEDLVAASSIDPALKNAMIKFQTDDKTAVVAYVSKMVAIPESELPEKKRKSGTALTPEEARELARRKRAEIAKAQALAEAGDATNPDSITNGLNQTRIGEDTENESTPEQPDDPEHLIGFARLYSGTLSVGDEIYVLPPKFSPAFPHASPEPKKVSVTALFLLMGRSLEPLTKVPAGVVFGIEGLEGHILKTGTLCSRLEGGINMAGTSILSQPIVRVALEPTNPMDLNKMIKGLKLLEQSDPCAVYEQMESGEHVILTAGELHLERCLKDLRERFAKCDIQPGEPIVPYRETIVKAEEMNPPKNKDLPRGTGIAVPASKAVSVRLRVRPLPLNVTEFLIKNGATIRRLYAEKKAEERQTRLANAESDETSTGGDEDEDGDDHDKTQNSADLGYDTGQDKGTLSIQAFQTQLQAAFDEIEDEKEAEVWQKVVPNICAFGPRRVGPNLFIDATGTTTCKRFLMEQQPQDEKVGDMNGNTDRKKPQHQTDFSETIVYAFQLATSQGPLCREPMQGVAVFLESITNAVTAPSSSAPVEPSSEATPASATVQTSFSSTESIDAGGVAIEPNSKEVATTQAPSSQAVPQDQQSGRLTGELITSIRETIRSSFLDWSPRILLAMYNCTIQATPEVLGRVYSVLTRRRGTILSESLLEGTPYFTIAATLPVAESFGFSDEIRKRTSGLAQPMLQFVGFELLEALDLDPFWVPRSEEELEDLGVHGERENVAKKYVDLVRRRKGLLIKGARGVGRDAEKQKTLKTN